MEKTYHWTTIKKAIRASFEEASEDSWGVKMHYENTLIPLLKKHLKKTPTN